MKTNIIHRDKINWIIEKNAIYAFDNIQATVYHIYGSSNRKPLARMKKKLLESDPDEYGNWVDVIGLANECKIQGYGTSIRKNWFEES